MKTLTATETARNFGRLLDLLGRGEEEVVITRNRQPVARLIPGTPRQTALDVLSDLYRTLDDEEGEAWLRTMRKLDRPLKKAPGKGRVRTS